MSSKINQPVSQQCHPSDCQPNASQPFNRSTAFTCSAVFQLGKWCLRHWLELGISFIVLASVYDAWLVYYFRSVIHEENAFCRWLISLEPEYVSVFLFGKLLGTSCVGYALYYLSRNWRKVAIPTVTAVVAFQVGLMGYLHTYDPIEQKRKAWQLANADAIKMRRELATPRIDAGFAEFDGGATRVAHSMPAGRVRRSANGNILNFWQGANRADRESHRRVARHVQPPRGKRPKYPPKRPGMRHVRPNRMSVDAT